MEHKGIIVIGNSDADSDWIKSGKGHKRETAIHERLAEKYKGSKFTHTVQFSQIDEPQRIVYGVVLQPDVVDSQGHTMTADEIEATCHRFSEKLALDEQHRRLVSGGASVAESWIQQERVTWRFTDWDGNTRETDVLPGSWCLAVQVHSDELWSDVLSGEITGFSPRGWGLLTQKEPDR